MKYKTIILIVCSLFDPPIELSRPAFVQWFPWNIRERVSSSSGGTSPARGARLAGLSFRSFPLMGSFIYDVYTCWGRRGC